MRFVQQRKDQNKNSESSILFPKITLPFISFNIIYDSVFTLSFKWKTCFDNNNNTGYLQKSFQGRFKKNWKG